MTDLLVSYLPECDLDREVLRIRWNHKAGLVELEYKETDSSLCKRWKKTGPPDEAFPALVRLLKTKKWFSLSEATLHEIFGKACGE